MAKKNHKNSTINFFIFTVVLVNVCFYFTLKRTSSTKTDLNTYALIFNVFLIFMLISIIRLLRKSPQFLKINEEKLAAHFEAFGETQIERKSSKENIYGTNEEFQLYLSNYGLRLCESCYVIRVVLSGKK